MSSSSKSATPHSLAEEHHLTLGQMARWRGTLRRAEVTSCIIGATRPQQIEENAEASGVKLEATTARSKKSA
jgi:aryl-alcohol dehydrogenase-like predicted oxidoreductase